MKINLVSKQSDEPLVLETQHNDPDKRVEIEFIGAKYLKNLFVSEVSQGKIGYYGHLFYLTDTTNLDLQKVVYDLDNFTVLSIEPKIEARKLPDGVVS